jgi:hypothetical protein
VIADTVHELIGDEWSPGIEDAWRKLLAEIDGVVVRSEAPG